MKLRMLLSNGVGIPAIGFGTYPMKGKVLSESVFHAYHSGYRMFDTSDNYYNEGDLGEALSILYANTSANRQDLFLVTKISDELYEPGTLGGGSNKGIYFWKSSPLMNGRNAVRDIVNMKVENSLRSMRTDYIDLLLLHWPYPDFFIEIWHEMEHIYRAGKVRAIGVCNCRERHIDKLKANSDIMPMVNQFECSPINTKEPLVSYCDANGIRIMVYSPLMNLRLRPSDSYMQYLTDLAAKYGKSREQIVLKFDMQRGLIPIPKSSNEKRIRSNIDIMDFNMTDVEMRELYGFNINRQYLPESRSCPGL